MTAAAAAGVGGSAMGSDQNRVNGSSVHGITAPLDAPKIFAGDDV